MTKFKKNENIEPNWECENDIWLDSGTWHCHCHITQSLSRDI